MSNQKESYKEEIDRATAVFQTNLGTFEAELYAKECPETVWNFFNLAEGRQETTRGGNYFDVPGNARCAVRLGLRSPSYSDSRDGFRICLGVPRE